MLRESLAAPPLSSSVGRICCRRHKSTNPPSIASSNAQLSPFTTISPCFFLCSEPTPVVPWKYCRLEWWWLGHDRTLERHTRNICLLLHHDDVAVTHFRHRNWLSLCNDIVFDVDVKIVLRFLLRQKMNLLKTHNPLFLSHPLPYMALLRP
ncbi:hypothetical protein PIB30_011528 [Stylosanthes scabra]|uniref:Uncharacterized protein n=1 Tax=Stylosanthes scabra TaxID=79078 RepID=A0ABU6T5M8_9FABA|nr:hypothetical protein [Stylosanthes scabra]